MYTLCRALLGLKEIEKLLALAGKEHGGHAGVSGLSPVHKAQVAALLHRETGRPVVFVTTDEQASRRMAEDLASLTGERVRVLTPRELNFYNAESASRRWEHQRMNVLYALAAGEAGVLCCDLEALLLRTMPPQLLREVAMTLRPEMELPIEVLVEQLVLCGYKRSLTVEGPGQFAVRGGIVDFFSPHGDTAVRLEFFGDEIDTINEMDTDTQRRGEPLEQALLLPAAEVLPMAAPGGLPGLADALSGLAGKARRKKDTHEPL